MQWKMRMKSNLLASFEYIIIIFGRVYSHRGDISKIQLVFGKLSNFDHN